MLNIKGASRVFSTLLAMVFVALVVGVVFKYSSLSGPESPPSLNPGASLFQGKLAVDNLAYYYADKKKSVADLMKCVGSGKLGFVYYASGDGLRNEGYYVYGLVAEGEDTAIGDPENFDIYPGRVFGLVGEVALDNGCVVAVTKFSGMGLTEVLSSFGSGWVQVVADTPDLSKAVKPVLNRAAEIWLQDGVDSFRKVEIENIDKEFFTGYYALWLKLYQT